MPPILGEEKLVGPAELCYNKLMIKKGDTLIEVTLAVGIFSMVAIAIVAVMSGGISGAQGALETTLAREEIDTQAEALRFIQASYIANKDSGEKKYTELWDAITVNAVNPSTGTDITQYAPASCAELYGNSGEVELHAFVINPRQLGNFYAAADGSANTESVVVKAESNTGANKVFNEASTYPRLIYLNEEKDNLVSTTTRNALYRAEGIYVIAVQEATNVLFGETPQFYDFYIRTCWYGTGDETPSTIATVIRLYNPDYITNDD